MIADTGSNADSQQKRAKTLAAESPDECQPSGPRDIRDTVHAHAPQQAAPAPKGEERLRIILETALDGFLISDRDGKLIETNDSYCRLTGYSREELLSMSIADIEADETPDDTVRHLRRLQELKYDRFITRHRCKDGRIIDVEISTNYLDIEGGRYFVFVRDVTELRKALERLKKNEARLQALVHILQQQCETIQEFLDHALQAAIRLTESGIGYFFFYSEAEKKFTVHTWSRDAMEACSITQPLTVYQLEETGIWGEAVRQRKEIIINDFNAPHPLKKGYPEGHPPLHKFLTVPVLNGERIVAVVGVANKQQDYTRDDALQLQLLMDGVWKEVERKQASETLLEYKAAVDQSADGIALADLNGHIRFANKAWAVMHGYSPEELTGMHLSTFHTPEQMEFEVTPFIKSVMSSDWREGEIGHVRRDGTTFTAQMTTTVLKAPDNTPVALLGVARDITERKQAELKQSEQMVELLRWHSATINREGRVLELKREVNELLTRSGQPVRYPSATIG